MNDTAFASRAEVVVVGAHDGFDYAELREAAQAAMRGATLVAAGRDPFFPMPDGPWPGTGAVVAAVETAAGVVAENVGKPSPAIVHAALDRLGPGRALFVGDRVETDLAAAANAGSTARSCSPARRPRCRRTGPRARSPCARAWPTSCSSDDRTSVVAP